MPLTDLQVRKAKTTDKPQKFSDGGGLYLLVQPGGAKYWRLKYRFGRVEKVLALGAYPDVTLLDAREKRDAARKLVHQNCGQVFRYAIATGRAQRDPAADLRGALPPPNRKHYPTLTDPKAIGELLRAINGYSGTYSTRYALRLAPMLFVRPSELR
jgi:hypothetical protein